MYKKLTLWILLLPVVAFSQTQVKDGSLIIDFGKKKPTTVEKDTTQQEKFVYPSDEEEQEEETPKQKREKKKAATAQQEDFNFKRDGLFKGLFSAGLNACQVDGDNEFGYKYLGASVNVGVMVRYHRFLSTSVEIGYSMRGARARFTGAGANANFFRTNFDYVEIPVSLLNVHDKKLVMFSVGLTPAVLIRYKEWDRVSGIEVSNNPPYGQPRKFDLTAFGSFYFVIKQQFALGAKFSYSLLSIRTAEPGSRVNGQYHNMLTFRFMYILSAIKKKP